MKYQKKKQNLNEKCKLNFQRIPDANGIWKAYKTRQTRNIKRHLMCYDNSCKEF